MTPRSSLLIAGALLATVAGCAAGTNGAGSATASSSPSVDPTKLPLGDGKVTTSGPRRGYIYSCGSGPGGGGGAFKDGPWIHGSRFDVTAKAVVDGSVSWPAAGTTFRVSGSRLVIAGNGLPRGQTTGTFPIAPGDDAFQYDRNPNAIAAQTVRVSLTAKPKRGSTAACERGEVGIARNGVAIFNGVDALNRDAVAHETQDRCGGHPQMSGVYHYHSIPTCLTRGESTRRHSRLVGYAYDGFPIYGGRGNGGRKVTNADLDGCHGHIHTVTLRGRRVRTYHYHATQEFPYTVGCFRGSSVVRAVTGG